MKVPNVGDLRHRVVVETTTDTTDDQGGQSSAWSTYATIWALIQPSRAVEVRASMQIQVRRTHICWIRHRADITVSEKMRINFDSRYFQIKGIRRADERKFFMCLELEEGVGT